MIILQLGQRTDKKFVALNGPMMNSNLHLVEMIIDFWSGKTKDSLIQSSNSVNIKQQ